MVIFRHFNLVIDFCISARNSINNHFFTRCPLTKSFSMLFNSTRNNPQTRMFCYTYSSVLTFVDSFYQFLYVLCILCMGRGTCALAYVIRSSGLFVTVFSEKYFRISPNRMQNISIYLRTNRRAKALFAKRNAHTRKNTSHVVKNTSHIFQNTRHIF